MEKILTQEEVSDFLKAVPGWSESNSMLAKEFRFPAFEDGVDFVSKLVPFFNQEDHHPDIEIHYTRITFKLATHSAGGLTQKDLRSAEAIQAAYDNMP
jgi:4a-hydroxytetrahydrobiopterin dehydratase